jgi:hypothetical protein
VQIVLDALFDEARQLAGAHCAAVRLEQRAQRVELVHFVAEDRHDRFIRLQNDGIDTHGNLLEPVVELIPRDHLSRIPFTPELQLTPVAVPARRRSRALSARVSPSASLNCFLRHVSSARAPRVRCAKVESGVRRA